MCLLFLTSFSSLPHIPSVSFKYAPEPGQLLSLFHSSQADSIQISQCAISRACTWRKPHGLSLVPGKSVEQVLRPQNYSGIFSLVCGQCLLLSPSTHIPCTGARSCLDFPVSGTNNSSPVLFLVCLFNLNWVSSTWNQIELMTPRSEKVLWGEEKQPLLNGWNVGSSW